MLPVFGLERKHFAYRAINKLIYLHTYIATTALRKTGQIMEKL